mmetsp:Transcript_7872/g.12509  ORF Transcript_7872/g.12509 Transcript_7872/m.12509 type:complete len:498 (+) Transcript_7872:446-1939(+)
MRLAPTRRRCIGCGPRDAMTTTTTTMIAKYGKLKIELPHLPTSTTSIYQVKELLCARTGILPKRQKILGLKCIRKGNAVGDDTMLSELKSGKGGGSKGGGTDAAVAAVAVLAHQFILMGTPEEKIFVDPSEKEGLVDIIDDFDLDFNAGSDEWIQHKAKEDNLQKFTDSTDIHIINPPRLQSSTSSNTNTSNSSSSSSSSSNNNNNNNTTKYKPLLVLDLDHTLLDFSSKTLRDNGASAMDIGQSDDAVANQLKRPYMDEFLTWTYKYYDLVVWSQTSWRWLEVKCLFLLNCALHRNMPSCHLYIDIPSKNPQIHSIFHSLSPSYIAPSKNQHSLAIYLRVQVKLTELGMLTHPGYKFCFVLDKTSMFQIVSTNRSGKQFTHHVKPLQIIWSKFPRYWNESNTVHLDDLSRNFALNLGNGLKCTAYYRKKRKKRSGSGSTSSSSSTNNGANDKELLGLGRFLELVATTEEVCDNFDRVDFQYWQDYVSGKREFQNKK